MSPQGVQKYQLFFGIRARKSALRKSVSVLAGLAGLAGWAGWLAGLAGLAGLG